MEAWIELFIKLYRIANILMTNRLDIMQEFTGFAITTTKVLLPKGVPTVIGGDYDAGFRLVMLMLAPIYLIISGACSITVLIEILGRFLNLFMLMAVALCTFLHLQEERGLENSAICGLKKLYQCACRYTAL